jgi:mannose/cellobiose epimerase-like protein (N-acyl-D-glucosamine 2-epimerase family)
MSRIALAWSVKTADAAAARLRTGLQLLQRDVLGFWLFHGPDQEYGGFHGALDRQVCAMMWAG